jgi:hypothetical protein
MTRSGCVRAWGVVLLVLAGLLSASSPALAAKAKRRLVEGEPATSGAVQFGVGGEYGVKVAGPELNPWGFGLGVYLGYTLPMGVYFGVPFDYFFGSKDTYGGAAIEAKLWQFGVEGGYDLALGREAVLRFKGGIGFAMLSTAGCSGDFAAPVCGHSLEAKPVFGPGLAFLHLESAAWPASSPAARSAAQTSSGGAPRASRSNTSCSNATIDAASWYAAR